MSLHPFKIAGFEGLPVHGDVWLPEHAAAAAPVVVGVHGFKGFRRWGFWPAIGARLNAAGFAFVGFDTSHNGVGDTGDVFDQPELFEKNTWAAESHDLAAVVSALRSGSLPESARIDVARLALLGHSRGGGLAIVHAAGDPGVRAVIALSPISTVRRLDEATLASGLRAGYVPIENTRTGQVMKLGAGALAEIVGRADLADIAASHASRLAAPLLVVHGDDDATVPAREGRALAAAAPHGRFVGIPGADHVLGCRHPWAGPTPAFGTFLAEVRAFLAQSLI